ASGYRNDDDQELREDGRNGQEADCLAGFQQAARVDSAADPPYRKGNTRRILELGASGDHEKSYEDATLHRFVVLPDQFVGYTRFYLIRSRKAAYLTTSENWTRWDFHETRISPKEQSAESAC